MSYWPQLLKNFTAHLYNGVYFVQINPAQIVEEWCGREVGVILIGNYHYSGTLVDQTHELIRECINVRQLKDRAIFLAEGLKPGISSFGHLLAPKDVEVIGADCRKYAGDSQDLKPDHFDRVRTVQKLLIDANAKSYKDIEDWCKTHVRMPAEHSFVFQNLSDYNKFRTILKGWNKDVDTLNQMARKHFESETNLQLDNVESLSNEGSESEWEDIDSDFDPESELEVEEEAKCSNRSLANLIERYHADNRLVFAVWGVAHFTEDLDFYEMLKRKGIKPLVLLPKSENELGYRIEFTRWMEAIEGDQNFNTISCSINQRKGAVKATIPIWAELMLTKAINTQRSKPDNNLSE